jgi:hypothetical protein
MKIAMAGPVLVTVVAGGSTLVTALTHRRPADIALAIGVWSFIAAVWLGALWIARGTWRPLAATTDAFLRLSIRRCRSVLGAIHFGAALYAVGFLGILAWKYYYLSASLSAVLTSWQVALFGGLVTPVLFCTLFFLAKRKRSELASLLDLQRQLEEDPPPA